VTATDGVDTATGGVKGSIDSAGVFVSMLGFYPVSDAFDLFGKVGMYYYDTDADMTIFASDSVSSVSEKVSGGNSDEEVTWGLGARYSFNRFAVRFEYERYERIEADEDLDLQADVDLWSVGLEYSF
jgi:predicted porin